MFFPEYEYERLKTMVQQAKARVRTRLDPRYGSKAVHAGYREDALAFSRRLTA
jgi:hypothetical protein